MVTDALDSNHNETGSIVISLRLDPELATEFRVEAARRGMRLNKLFAEMWSQYAKAADGAAR